MYFLFDHESNSRTVLQVQKLLLGMFIVLVQGLSGFVRSCTCGWIKNTNVVTCNLTLTFDLYLLMNFLLMLLVARCSALSCWFASEALSYYEAAPLSSLSSLRKNFE